MAGDLGILDATARRYARQLREAAAQVAPEVRGTLLEIVGRQGGELRGLEHELKSEGSLARKLLDRTLESARRPTADTVARQAHRMNDVLRYTVVTTADRYMAVYGATVASLASRGFGLQREPWNAWQDPDRVAGTYRGINATFAAPGGMLFEVQFHTDESYRLKVALHGLYAELRARGTTPERRYEVAEEMRQRWRAVATPVRAGGEHTP